SAAAGSVGAAVEAADVVARARSLEGGGQRARRGSRDGQGMGRVACQSAMFAPVGSVMRLISPEAPTFVTSIRIFAPSVIASPVRFAVRRRARYHVRHQPAASALADLEHRVGAPAARHGSVLELPIEKLRVELAGLPEVVGMQLDVNEWIWHGALPFDGD